MARFALPLIALLALTAPASAQDIREQEVTAPGPKGALHGTLIAPAKARPLLLIIPGSGPTDRDGNNRLGVKAASYKLLAEALAGRGIGTARIDKRGLFASAGAVDDPNKVTIADYAADIHHWVASLRATTGVRCVWLVGHSEGGLIALATAQQPEGICGVVLVSTAGRTMGEVIRAQLTSNPANAPLLPQALGAIDTLEKGEHVDVTGMHPALHGLFNPAVQDYLIDMMAIDPATLAAKIRLPMLIVQGEQDLQVLPADAQALKTAQPRATLTLIPGVNHVLKHVEGDDRAANMAAYADPARPIDPAVVAAIADFVTTGKGAR